MKMRGARVFVSNGDRVGRVDVYSHREFVISYTLQVILWGFFVYPIIFERAQYELFWSAFNQHSISQILKCPKVAGMYLNTIFWQSEKVSAG